MIRPVVDLVTLNLPVPPSVNAAFAARRGTHTLMKTADYRFWLREVRETYGNGESLPKLRDGKYGLWIDLSPEMKGDIDNRVKLLSDVIKNPKAAGDDGLGIVSDDKAMRMLYVGVCGGLPRNRCAITLVRKRLWAGYVKMRIE